MPDTMQLGGYDLIGGEPYEPSLVKDTFRRQQERERQAAAIRRQAALDQHLADYNDDPVSRAWGEAEFRLKEQEAAQTQVRDREQSISDEQDDPVSKAWAIATSRLKQREQPQVKAAQAEQEAIERQLRQGRMSSALDAVTPNNAFVRETVGGALNAAPDFVSLAARLSGSGDAAAELTRQSQEFGQARGELRSEDMSPWLSGMYGGAVQNIVQMAGTPGGAYGKIAGAALNAGNQALTTAEDAGVTGNARLRYAGTQALFEGGVAAIFQKAFPNLGAESRVAGQGVAAQTWRQLAKNVGKDALAEMPEEAITSVLQDLSSKLEGVSPDMTPGDFAKNAAEAAFQSVLMAGIGNTPNAARLFIERPSRENYKALPPALKLPGKPETYVPPGDQRAALAEKLKGPVTPPSEPSDTRSQEPNPVSQPGEEVIPVQGPSVPAPNVPAIDFSQMSEDEIDRWLNASQGVPAAETTNPEETKGGSNELQDQEGQRREGRQGLLTPDEPRLQGPARQQMQQWLRTNPEQGLAPPAPGRPSPNEKATAPEESTKVLYPSGDGQQGSVADKTVQPARPQDKRLAPYIEKLKKDYPPDYFEAEDDGVSYEDRIRAIAERDADEDESNAEEKRLKDMTAEERVRENGSDSWDRRDVAQERFAEHGIQPLHLSEGSTYFNVGGMKVRFSDHDPSQGREAEFGAAGVDVNTGDSPRDSTDSVKADPDHIRSVVDRIVQKYAPGKFQGRQPENPAASLPAGPSQGRETQPEPKGEAVSPVPVRQGRYATYPINTSQGPRIAVQNGDKPGVGDTVHATQRAADEHVAKIKAMDAANEASRARDAAKATADAEQKAQTDQSLNEYLESTGHSAMQKGKVRGALTGNAARRSTDTGKIYQGRRDAVVREMVGDGWTAETREVPAIKEASRTQFNRMDGKEQAAYEKRRAEAGNKTEHVLVKGDSTFTVTKAEHDYADWLTKKTTQPTGPAPSSPTATEPQWDEQGPVVDTPKLEPWQMTRAEYENQPVEVTVSNPRGGPRTKSSIPRSDYLERIRAGGQAEILHRVSVEKAIAAGKPVPAEVLAEYPDLAKPDQGQKLEPWQMNPKQYAKSRIGTKAEKQPGMGRADTITADHRAEVRKAFNQGQDVPWQALEPYIDDFIREGGESRLKTRVSDDVAAGREVPVPVLKRYPPGRAAENKPAAKAPWQEKLDEIKRENGDALVLFRMGDFYEMFGDDAKKAAKTLGLTLTSRDKSSDNPIPMAGFPYHSLEGYLHKLVKAGHRVAVAEDPTGKKGVKRNVTVEEPAKTRDEERYPGSPVGSVSSGYRIMGGDKFAPEERLTHARKQRDQLLSEAKELRKNAAVAPMTGAQFELRNSRAKKATRLAEIKAQVAAWDVEIQNATKPANPVQEPAKTPEVAAQPVSPGAKWTAAQAAYRSGRIGDEEFLAAKKEWDANQAAFDQKRGEQAPNTVNSQKIDSELTVPIDNKTDTSLTTKTTGQRQKGLAGLEDVAAETEAKESLALDNVANRNFLTGFGGREFADSHQTALRRLPGKIKARLAEVGEVSEEEIQGWLKQDLPKHLEHKEDQYDDWTKEVTIDAMNAASDGPTLTVTVPSGRKKSMQTWNVGDRVQEGDEYGTITAIAKEVVDGSIITFPEVTFDGDKKATQTSFSDISWVDPVEEEHNARLDRRTELEDNWSDGNPADNTREAVDAELTERVKTYFSPVDYENAGLEGKTGIDLLDSASTFAGDNKRLKLTSLSKELKALENWYYDALPNVDEAPAPVEKAQGSEPTVPADTGSQSESPAIPKYERTGPASDSPEIDDIRAKMDKAREETVERDQWIKKAEADKKGKRRGSKPLKQLEEVIRHHQEQRHKADSTYRSLSREVEKSRTEDILEKPPTYDHYLKAMVDLHELEVSDAIEQRDAAVRLSSDQSRKKEADSAEEFHYQRKKEAQSKVDEAAAKLLDRIRDIAKRDESLNPDEIKSVVEQAYLGFSYRDKSLDDAVQREIAKRKATRKGAHDWKIDKLTSLSKEQAESFKARLADIATKGEKDWWQQSEALIAKAEQSNKTAGDAAALESEKQKAIDDAEAAEKAKAIAEEKRVKAREFAGEKRAWKRLAERTKEAKWEKETYTVKEGKDNQDVSDVQGEVFGPFGVREVVERDDGGVAKEKWWTITHLGTGMPISSYKTKANARSLAVWLTESGVKWESPQIATEGKITGDDASTAKRWIRAFDDNDLRGLNPDEKAAILKASGPKASGVEADLILDAADLGVGSKKEAPFVKKAREMASAVPEFAYNPVFTVQGQETLKAQWKDKRGNDVEYTALQGGLKLVFKDGMTFTFNPEVFGLESEELTPGQTVGINLEDLGIKRLDATGMVAALFKEKGFQVSPFKPGQTSLTAKWKPSPYAGKMNVMTLIANDDGRWGVQYDTGSSGTQGAKLAQQVLDGIRWTQPGQAAKGQGPEDVAPSPANTPTLSEKAAAARQEALEEGKAFLKSIGGTTPNIGSFSPESMQHFTRMTAKLIKAGVLTFAEYSAGAAEILGDRVHEFESLMKQTWARMAAVDKRLDPATEEVAKPEKVEASGPTLFDEAGPESAEVGGTERKSAEVPPAEPPADRDRVSDDGDRTSIKNAVVDELRAERGKPEMETAPPESQQGWLDDARKRIDDDPTLADRLVDKLHENAVNLEPVEIAALQIHQRTLVNAYRKASDELFEAKKSGGDVDVETARTAIEALETKLQALEEATKAAGTQWGRAGVARQIELAADYSLAGVVRRAMVAKGGSELTEGERDQIKALHEKYEQTKTTLDEFTTKVQELEARLRVQEQINQEKAKPKPKESSEKSAARAKVEDAWKAFSKAVGGKFYSNPLDPEALAAAVVLTKAYVELGVVSFKEFIKQASRRMGPEKVAEFEPAFKQAWDQLKAENPDALKPPAPKVNPDVTSSVQRAARELARWFVAEAGITEVDELVDAVHKELQVGVPGITRRQTMDAISGYGDYTELSKEQIEVQLRDLRGQMHQLGKLDDMAQGQAPLKTGQQRREPSDKERQLIQQVNEAKRRGGYTVTDPEAQLKTALDARKTYLKNRMTDLQQEIDTKQRIVKDKTPSPSDPELDALRAEYEQVKSAHEAMFPKPGITDAHRLELAVAAAERNEKYWTERLEKAKKGDFTDGRVKTPPLTGPALDAIQARVDAVKQQYQELKDLANPKKTPAEREDARYRTWVKNATAKLLDRIARKDFAPQPKRPDPQRSAEALKLRFEHEQAKQKFADLFTEWQKANRHPVKKAIDFGREVLNTSRSVMTSFDLSAVARQGGWLSAGHPGMAVKAASQMVAHSQDDKSGYSVLNPLKYIPNVLTSERDLFKIEEELAARPNANLYKKSKLALTGVHGKITNMEEAYMGQWAKHIPGVAGSERAYVAYLNVMRANTFDAMAATLSKGGALTDGEAKIIANYVNVASGRGSDLGGGKLASAAAGLASVFFSPRYVVSRFQLAMGQPLLTAPGQGSLRVRALVAGEYARSLTGLGLFYGLTAAALTALYGLHPDDDDEKWSIEEDPRSSDFGKIRIGDTRIDPLAGLSQTVVVGTRLSIGEKKKPSGQVVPIVGDNIPFGGSTWMSTAGRFIQSKLAPAISIPIELRTGRDYNDEKVTPEQTLQRGFTPLAVKEIYDAMKSQGMERGTAISLLALLGFGAQSYPSRNIHDFKAAAEDAISQPKTESGKISQKAGLKALQEIELTATQKKELAADEEFVGKLQRKVSDPDKDESTRQAKALAKKLGVTRDAMLKSLDAEYQREYDAQERKRYPNALPRRFKRTDAYDKRRAAIEAL